MRENQMRESRGSMNTLMGRIESKNICSVKDIPDLIKIQELRRSGTVIVKISKLHYALVYNMQEIARKACRVKIQVVNSAVHSHAPTERKNNM